MSQLILPVEDVSSANFSPTPIWDEIDQNDPTGHIISADAHGGLNDCVFHVALGQYAIPQSGTYQIKIHSLGGLTSGVGGFFYDVDLFIQGACLNSINYSVALPVAPGPGGFVDTHTFDASEIQSYILGSAADVYPNGGTGQAYFSLRLRVTGGGAGDIYAVRIYYIEMIVPDAFDYSITPASGTKAGGTPITISARGIGFVAVDPADLRIQFGTDFNEITPTVVDDDTVTCITPANSIDTASSLYIYDAASSFTRFMSLNLDPPDMTTALWTYGAAAAPTLEITGDGGVEVGGDATTQTGISMTASGGITVTGRSQFEFFSRSIPEPQNGSQWRLNTFVFKYRPEEQS